VVLTALSGVCEWTSTAVSLAYSPWLILVISVFLVILAVLLENSGLLKAGGPRAAEFEPTEGKKVTFSDVHGVDEAKEVHMSIFSRGNIH
jgi:ATP-dependent Zn protease